ncbi:hypothetical protein WH52_05570 [Tenacibaculum holothuriorum]|uniref:Lipocalin-like domain-containing protein n=1 Tax=Tenacibaculum holothuriorum TaxID=1635173 RepID=A0A1Y2PEN0_9FLAO|nr:lipocalin family protein [Tenacibaculum holothuriorum]OSY88247.1 hypothetical protein WH52_05570 [Tenacibaculum holothuriorum]
MKKLLVLLIAMLSLFSCSSDDENLDPFVGTWKLFSNRQGEVNECEKKTTIIINESGTYSSSYYYEENNACTNGNATGVWENAGNGIYEIKESGSNQVELANITFKDNNKTFVITETDNDNGVTKTYTIVYKRK